MLAPGTRLGPYEITSPLGAGGMGEVYRAHDTRLGRDVAVKVLPAHYAADADSRARLEAEARTTGSLNHPNLVTVFDIGEQDGSLYVVMELLEGESLRERLRTSQSLSPKRAIDYGAQIANGLAAAHERGVVHRDLKPENILLTADGRAKILDFGLAKAVTVARADVSSAPTAQKITSPGMVVGTAAYMSPEQVRGQAVDHRSDIFSLGGVIYEMLSGRRPFDGDSAADTMSAILKEDPGELTSSKGAISPALERIVSHCLEKAPEQRFQSARDVAFDLESLSTMTSGSLQKVATRRRRGRALAITAIVAALGIAAMFGWLLGRRNAPAADPHAGASFERLTWLAGMERDGRIAPDGKNFAFVSNRDGDFDIYVQRVGGQNAVNLTPNSSEPDVHPAFSPEGERIAFSSGVEGNLSVMGATGESLRRIGERGFNPAWSPDGTKLVYSTEAVVNEPFVRVAGADLWVVEVRGGRKRRLPVADGVQPAWSPHGHRIAYWGVRGHSGQRDIFTVAANTEGAQPVDVTNDASIDWNPVWSPDGKFLYYGSDRNGTQNLWRVPIDERTGRTSGEPQPVVLPAEFAGSFSVANDGSVLFTAYERRSETLRLSIDPKTFRPAGEPAMILAGAMVPLGVAASPDGSLLALGSAEQQQQDLYVMRTDGSEMRQLLDDTARDRSPTWSPDGTVIYFQSDRGAARYDIWKIRPDGSGLEQVTRTAEGPGLWVPNVSPDGRKVVACNDTGSFIVDLTLPLEKRAHRKIPDALPEHVNYLPRWSPTGRWITMNLGWPSRGVAIHNLETGKTEKITERGGGALFIHDDEHIIYALENRLWILDRRSGATHPVTDPFDGVLRHSVTGDDVYMTRIRAAGDIWIMKPR